MMSAFWRGVLYVGFGLSATGVLAEDSRSLVKKPDKLSLSQVSETRIFGGRFAKPGEIPWQVSLRIRKSDGVYLCGGSAIAADWVLTAAHCVEDDSAKDSTPNRPAQVPALNINVRSGSIYIDEGGLEATAKQVARMDDSRDPKTNAFDVALLHVQLDASARPIALQTATTAEPLAVATPVMASGYGRTETQDYSPALKLVDLKYVQRKACNGPQSYNGVVLSEMICAGSIAGHDACTGDSGGPLFAPASSDGQTPAQLVGVVSMGQGCAVPDFPGIYAQVSNPAIAKWIASITKPHNQ